MQAEDIYDVVIVGFGPAGATAAIYAARKRLSVLLLGEEPGGEVRNSGEIENWPGDGETTGIKLAQKFIEHVKKHSDVVNIVSDRVTQIKKGQGGIFVCEGQKNIYRGRSVIYATGRRPRLLNVPGEKEFTNKGVTYCATCDAPLFAGKEVAVIGGGNTGAEAVIMLQRIAQKIHLFHIGEKLTADPILVESFLSDPKVEVHYNAVTIEITGDTLVSTLSYRDALNNSEHSLPVEGVFVAIGSEPNSAAVQDIVELDQYQAIVADRYGLTSLPGLFAAGDVTNIRDAQIVVAAGHGCSAALSAGDYLIRLENITSSKD